MSGALKIQESGCYEIIESNDCGILVLKGNQGKKEADELISVLKKMESNGKLTVFICRELQSVDNFWIKEIGKYVSSQIKDKNLLCFVQLSKEIRKMVEQLGLDNLFVAFSDLRSAKVHNGVIGPKTIDVGFVNPIIEATKYVLSIQAHTDVEFGKISLKGDPKDRMSGDISGVIAIVCDSFHGNLIISFTETTFLNIMNKMMGTDYKKIDAEIVDGAAELLNIIFGQAKKTLNTTGYRLQHTIPSLVTGKNHSVGTRSSCPVVVLPVKSTSGDFRIEISIEDFS